MRIAGSLTGAAVVALTLAMAGGIATASTTSWKIELTPAAGAGLLAVSCTAASACTAVGSSQSGQALAERWNGQAWKIQTVPQPAGSGAAVLDGVSCASASACTAVGDYQASSGAQKTLAEQWNGTAWKIQSTPNPSGSSPSLTSVSCPATTACTAVGYYSANSGTQKALAERWNGSTWAVESAASPPGPVTYLESVSCPAADTCLAVGYYDTTSGAQKTLAESWNGTAWTLQPPVNPGGSYPGLFAVSCASASACTAVGDYTNPSGKQKLLIESWEGTAWSMQAAANPGSFPSLSGISCPAVTDCTATGNYDTSHGWKTLAEHWDGTSWAIQPTPDPSGKVPDLDAVSCPAAAACTAVGHYQTGSSTINSLAERYGPA